MTVEGLFPSKFVLPFVFFSRLLEPKAMLPIERLNLRKEHFFVLVWFGRFV